MKTFKRLTALCLTAAMVFGCVSFASAGSAEKKYTTETTADGWIKVTQEGGETLGYSPDSGVTLLEDDGFAFKDLNKNGTLDVYEDWRKTDDERAADLAGKMTIEQMAGLMVCSGGLGMANAVLSDDEKSMLDSNMRFFMNRVISGATAADIVAWNNAMQTYAEGSELGIPVHFTTDPRSDGTAWPCSLAIASTFDPTIAFEAAVQGSKEMAAIGVGTLLGPQAELATEPRWERISGTFGEDPALVSDMDNAYVSGLQSTYSADGTDLGWGKDSVIAMIKHFPGDGAAQAGRESHNFSGKYNVYPGGQFTTSLIPFFDACLNLNSITKKAAAVMPSYSVAWSDDGSLGELVGSAFSEYKIQMLRNNGFDGVICSDWEVLSWHTWGETEKYTDEERVVIALNAGIDQFGGEKSPTPILGGFELLKEDIGEDAALTRYRESVVRLLKNTFLLGIFENGYEDATYAAVVYNDKDAVNAAYEAQLKSIVMLKNDGVISGNTSTKKPTVYIPFVYTSSIMQSAEETIAATAGLPVSYDTLRKYFNVVSDTISTTLTGKPDSEGKATIAYEDIIRATPEQLAKCDYALVFPRFPSTIKTGIRGTGGVGYDTLTGSYIPITLQYGDYVANSIGVRQESIAGDMITTTTETPYGPMEITEKENQSYYGQHAMCGNPTDLDMIKYACNNMPEGLPVIVSLNATNGLAVMIVSEFEADVDAILISWKADLSAILDVVTGKYEPSALLPIQMPANMETVEAQYEDVPRDMECYVDSNGNTYDFAFGLNWSGVINDERVQKYNVPALTEPETQIVK